LSEHIGNRAANGTFQAANKTAVSLRASPEDTVTSNSPPQQPYSFVATVLRSPL
jgi:hypothetical protein